MASVAVKRPDLSVPDLAALSQLHVAELEDGSYVWVAAESEYFTLRKDSGAAVNADIIAPIQGAPSAGAAGARWFRTADELTHAIFTATINIQFPNPGVPIITVNAAPMRCYRCSFVGFSIPFPGIIQIDAVLDTPLDAARRAEIGSVAPETIQNLDPIIPLAISLSSATGNVLTIIVPANNPAPAPGSPDVNADVHVHLLDPMAGRP